MNQMTHHFKPRNYQTILSEKGYNQITKRGWCYLSMEVRTGKTFTALMIAKRFIGRTIFVTKKKAISSVLNDINAIGIENTEVINYESLHKLDMAEPVKTWIIDEAHRLGGFPKPSKATKQLKEIIKNSNVIYLSGTPTPESTSQIYHQMFILGQRSPLKETTFYKWAHKNVNIKEKRFGHGYPVKDYSDCTFNIESLNFLTYSQKDAGFNSNITEHFIKVKMKPITHKIINALKEHKIFEGKNDVILADTAVKEMQKIHQLSSGTCILDESQKSIIIDDSKMIYVKDAFKNQKIAYFYKFKAEYELIKKHDPTVTNSIEEFDNNDVNIALQFVSGREGVKLNNADCIVALNIDFSATTYFQFRDRMTTIDRLNSDVFFIISDCGIEKDVYNAVSKKKTFTKRFYERTRHSKKNNKENGGQGVLRFESN